MKADHVTSVFINICNCCLFGCCKQVKLLAFYFSLARDKSPFNWVVTRYLLSKTSINQALGCFEVFWFLSTFSRVFRSHIIDSSRSCTGQEKRPLYSSEEGKKEERCLPVAGGNQGPPVHSKMLGGVLKTTWPREHGQHISPGFSVHHHVKNSPQCEKETMTSFDENFKKK